MTDLLTPIDQPDHEPEPIDFNSPEDVLIEVVCDNEAYMGDPIWSDHSIEYSTVISGKDGIMGAASYEQSYGSFLDYTIEGLIDCPGAGFFVVEGVTGDYIKGDGYTSDDDMRFFYKSVRRATAEERAMA